MLIWTLKTKATILSKVIQLLQISYTQPYSFGGRIKLIICQIRPELSVTIQEISSTWNKNIRWRTHYILCFIRTHYNVDLQYTGCNKYAYNADIKLIPIEICLIHTPSHLDSFINDSSKSSKHSFTKLQS